jgi:hypothetical protein
LPTTKARQTRISSESSQRGWSPPPVTHAG